jgi:septal ring factor EnvC (AmiA/AmiB activator)
MDEETKQTPDTPNGEESPVVEESFPVGDTNPSAVDGSPALLPEQLSQPDEQPRAESPLMSKARRLARNALIALGLILLIFFAGFLTDHFARYQPMYDSMTAEIRTLTGDLAESRQQTADLERKNESLSGSLTIANARIADLESENAGLQTDLDMAAMRTELLHTLADFNAAHIALANDDISGAKVALLNTQKRIDTLAPLIATVDAALAENMSSRFALVLSALETDPETAQADLGLLAKNLLNVEKLIFDQ